LQSVEQPPKKRGTLLRAATESKSSYVNEGLGENGGSARPAKRSRSNLLKQYNTRGPRSFTVAVPNKSSEPRAVASGPAPKDFGSFGRKAAA